MQTVSIDSRGRTQTFLCDGITRQIHEGNTRSMFETKKENAAHRREDQLLKISVKTPTETDIKEKLHQLILEYFRNQ